MRRKHVAEILVSPEGMTNSAGIEPGLAGFELRMTLLEASAPVPAESSRSSDVLVLEVRRDQPASLERFRKLVKASHGPRMVAAVSQLSLEDARSLLRSGAADVVSLPLQAEELRGVLETIGADLDAAPDSSSKGRIVSVVKSVGGVGATALLTQLACLYAIQEKKKGGEVCLLDLDVQFGSAALYLGALPKLNLKHLLEAGSRADGSLLRATAGLHGSGLYYIASPSDMMPLESIDPDQIMGISTLAAEEFGTVFVDLPSNWTNWSLSLLAQSDLILLVSELSVASIHQTRRQLELIRQQDLDQIPLQIVMNRVEKRMFRNIDVSDAERTLGRNIAYTIADDPQTVSAALDQGVMLTDIRSKTRVSRDLAAMLTGISATVAAR